MSTAGACGPLRLRAACALLLGTALATHAAATKGGPAPPACDSDARAADASEIAWSKDNDFASLLSTRRVGRESRSGGARQPTYAAGIHHKTVPPLQSDEEFSKDFVRDSQPDRPMYGEAAASSTVDGIIGNAVNDRLDSATDAINGAVDAADDTIGNAVNDSLDSATDAINNALDAASDTVDDTIGKAVNDSLDSATDAINDVLDAANDTVDDTIGKAVNDRLDNATDAINDALDAASDTVDDTIGNAVNDSLDSATDAINGVVDAANDTIGNAADALGGALDRLTDALASAAASVSSNFASTSDAASTSGKPETGADQEPKDTSHAGKHVISQGAAIWLLVFALIAAGAVVFLTMKTLE